MAEKQTLQHIAFIMDGNGRWATQRGLNRREGHKAGVKNMQRTIEQCFELGIKCVTVFAFSTENWNRPQEEIESLFNLVREYLKRIIGDDKQIKKDNVRFEFIGDITKFDSDIVDSIARVRQVSRACTGGTVCIALNYGGRQDILQATNNAILLRKTITEQELERLFYTAPLPPIDAIVRTGGECRLSNFMLYQAAYAELFFTPTLWPDFDKAELSHIFEDFTKRQRRFGAITQ